MPWIYHYYAGHDNNRDWFMFNLPETRAVTKVLYHDWLPQIHIDEHQMGSTAAAPLHPAVHGPPVPNVQPLLWRGVNLCGATMAYDLEKNGYRGVNTAAALRAGGSAPATIPPGSTMSSDSSARWRR